MAGDLVHDEDVVTQAIGDGVRFEYDLILTGDVHEDEIVIFGCRAVLRNVYRRLTGLETEDSDTAISLALDLTGQTYRNLIEE